MTAHLVLLAFLVSAGSLLLLRPWAGALGLAAPADVPAVQGFHAPVLGGVALVLALAAVWLRVDGAPAALGMVLAIAAVRNVAGFRAESARLGYLLHWGLDVITAVTLLRGLGHSLATPQAWLAVLACVALMQGIHRLRSLDGLAALTGLVAFAGLACLTEAPAAQWLAAAAAAALAGLLLFNLPFRANRNWRVTLGQGGGGALALVLMAAALLALAAPPAGAGLAVTPVRLLWLVPIPVCELLAMLAGRPPAHQRLLQVGFSVVAIFLLYLYVTLVAAVVALTLSQPDAVLLGTFAVLVLLWFLALWQAPRLMWLLPWRLRRIDVPKAP